MSYTYLASPYSHLSADVRHARYIEAMRATLWLLQHRQWVFSPIVHCHEIAVLNDLPTNALYWRDFNRAMLEKASSFTILALEGWDKSNGIADEIDTAHDLSIPIRFLTHPVYRIEERSSS